MKTIKQISSYDPIIKIDLSTSDLVSVVSDAFSAILTFKSAPTELFNILKTMVNTAIDEDSLAILVSAPYKLNHDSNSLTIYKQNLKWIVES